MKYYILYIVLFFQSLCFTSDIHGQSWEFFFDDIFLAQTYDHFVFPGPDNGVRLSGTYYFNIFQASPFFSFDQSGNYLGETANEWTEDWRLVNADKTGATYWVIYYKLRKLTMDNQFAWTYDAQPANGTLLWTQAAPNGNTLLAYYNNLHLLMLELISSEGQLINRFEYQKVSNVQYFPGYDNSLIGTEDTFPSSSYHWTKKNQLNQVEWTINLSLNERFLGGSLPDGSTYYTKGDTLVKLNALGTIEWQQDVKAYFPTSNSLAFESLLAREDGSIIFAITTYGAFGIGHTPHFVNIDPVNGNLIWRKQVASDVGGASTGHLIEMPDGGILTCFKPSWGVDAETKVLLVRTDSVGNTLTANISGKVYLDEVKDCTLQNVEQGVKNITVIAESGTKMYAAATDSSGHFSIAASTGEYSLRIAQPGSYVKYCHAQSPIHLEALNDTAWLPIGIQHIVDCPELQLSIGSPVFRRCFDNNYLTVQYQNVGTAAATNAYVTITLDPKLMYISSTAPVSSQNGQTYTFDLGTLDIGESGMFFIYFKVDCDAEQGEILCVNSHIYPDTLCIPTLSPKTENRFCLPVVTSYDPNDKTAFVNGKPETVKILPDVGLEYLIRFQNTGNDTAFNIVITDTLSSQLDAASVIPGASSHPYTYELRDGNVLRFAFNNILLPDSNINEPASHGFVKFFVRQKPGNLIGSTLSNKAAIFFDFNDPIITNESKLVVSNSVGTKETAIGWAKAWPVPAHDQVVLSLPAGSPDILSWKLIDLTGGVMRSGNAEMAQVRIRRNGLPSGVYWCQLLLKNGETALGKVIFD